MDTVAAAAGPALLERGGALAAVGSLADRAQAGVGCLAYVAAGAGLGKTALLDECAAMLAARGMRVLRACGAELEQDFPFGIARQLLTPVARSMELVEAIFTGAAAAARVLFSDAPTGSQVFGVEPFEITHALYWALANLCDLGPVAVLVDDAYEADSASLQLLSFVTHRLADLPLLVVIASRPTAGTDVTASAARSALRAIEDAASEMVTLQPLSRDAVSAVVRDVFGPRADDAFVAACAEATGGNPFYLLELVHAATERGLGATADSAPWIAELGPATIVRRSLFQLASLPAAAVPVARSVAVLGDGAHLASCARLAGVTLDEAAQAADALVRDGVLLSGPRLAFRHPILRAAVLSDLGEHSRRVWHAKAARQLDEAGSGPEAVAVHLLRTDPSGDPHLRDVLTRAGQQAAREGSPMTAMQLLRRAVAEKPAEPGADLSYELGLAEASVGNPGGLKLMATGVLATVEADERVHRALRLANLQMRSGDLVEAVRMLDQLRQGVGRDAELLLAIDTARYWAGRLHPATRDEAVGVLADLKTRATGPDTPARRTLLAYLGCEAAQTESAAAAWCYFERALATPGLLTLVPFDAVAVHASMLSLSAIERHTEFERLADSVLAEAGRRGALLTFLIVSTFRCMALLRDGDLAGAETEAGEALRAAAEQGWRPGAAGLAALRTIALLEQGELQLAEQALADAERMEVAPGFPEALLCAARGHVAAQAGDVERAVAELLQCGSTLHGMGLDSPGVLSWRSEAAVLLASSHHIEQARQLASEELDLARRLAGPIATGRALHALARASCREEQIGLLRQARATLADTPARLIQALVAVDLGASLRRAKKPAEARPLLSEGLEGAGRCRSTPLLARARDELAVLGVVPRRTAGFGPLALTPSEIRVARLAAAGRSNTDIAQQLFITRKTVEKHLASCYRKLGIDTRAQLDLGDLDGTEPAAGKGRVLSPMTPDGSAVNLNP